MKSKIDNNLRNAKNIGATIEKYLNEIGIFTLADLAETTSVKAFIKIREQHPEKTISWCNVGCVTSFFPGRFCKAFY